jgi:hypothetical protein
MRAVRTVVIVTIIAAGLTALAQTPVLRPGKYATTMEMDMPGGQKMPPTKTEQCITAAEIKDFSKAMLSKEMQGCKVSDYKADTNKLSFTAVCNQAGVESSLAADMTFTADTYNSVMKIKTTMGEMTMRSAAKRIGDCTK